MSDADTGVSPPYDIDVSVLGSQMQRRHSVGVGGLWLQHGCTHVAAEQELHHLQECVQSLKMKVKLPLSANVCSRPVLLRSPFRSRAGVGWPTF